MRHCEAMHTGVADTGLSREAQDARVYTITRNRVGESNSRTGNGPEEVGKMGSE